MHRGSAGRGPPSWQRTAWWLTALAVCSCTVAQSVTLSSTATVSSTMPPSASVSAAPYANASPSNLPSSSVITVTGCGPTGQNWVCGLGQCCSIYGWCGTGPSFCDPSVCQPAFGACNVTAMSMSPSPSVSALPSPSPVGATPSPVRSGSVATVCGNGVCELPWAINGESCGNCPLDCGPCQALQDAVQCAAPGQYVLTYDDGPVPGVTDTLLAILQANSALKASFFLIGANIDRAGALMQVEVAQGHETYSHTYTHPQLTTLPIQQVYTEMVMTEAAFTRVSCRRPTLMRPPYGDINHQVRGMLHNMGYRAVVWSFDSRDWMIAASDPASVLAWVRGNLTALKPLGLFGLEHDLNSATVALAQSVIDMVVAAGYSFVSLEQCLWGPTYRYHPSYAHMYRLCTGANDTGLWPAANASVPCPLSDWSEWSACDTPCGTGGQTRVRYTLPPGLEVTLPACSGAQLIQDRGCTAGVPCDAGCVYGAWSAWSSCSRTCAGGTQLSVRAVVNGSTCGPVTQTALCNLQACPSVSPSVSPTPSNTKTAKVSFAAPASASPSERAATASVTASPTASRSNGTYAAGLGSRSSGLSPGGVAGVVFGVLGGLLVVVVGTYWYYQRRREKEARARLQRARARAPSKASTGRSGGRPFGGPDDIMSLLYGTEPGVGRLNASPDGMSGVDGPRPIRVPPHAHDAPASTAGSSTRSHSDSGKGQAAEFGLSSDGASIGSSGGPAVSGSVGQPRAAVVEPPVSVAVEGSATAGPQLSAEATAAPSPGSAGVGVAGPVVEGPEGRAPRRLPPALHIDTSLPPPGAPPAADENPVPTEDITVTLPPAVLSSIVTDALAAAKEKSVATPSPRARTRTRPGPKSHAQSANALPSHARTHEATGSPRSARGGSRRKPVRAVARAKVPARSSVSPARERRRSPSPPPDPLGDFVQHHLIHPNDTASVVSSVVGLVSTRDQFRKEVAAATGMPRRQASAEADARLAYRLQASVSRHRLERAASGEGWGPATFKYNPNGHLGGESPPPAPTPLTPPPLTTATRRQRRPSDESDDSVMDLAVRLTNKFRGVEARHGAVAARGRQVMDELRRSASPVGPVHARSPSPSPRSPSPFRRSPSPARRPPFV